MHELTNGELGRQISALSEVVAQGFDGVNTRIEGLTTQVRLTNGRVGVLETDRAVANQRVANVERELFSSWKRPLTRGDAAMFVAGGGALLAAIRWLPALFQAGQGAP